MPTGPRRILQEFLGTEELLRHLNQLILEARDRFGPTNSVLFQYYHLRIACLLKEIDKLDFGTALSVVETLREIARIAFGVEAVCFGRPSDLHNSIVPFYFPKVAFTAEYVGALNRFSPLISKELTFAPSHQHLFNRFSYVIGPDLQLRYFLNPQAVSNVLLGNRDQNLSPFHPVLAHDLGLTVACAGEVTFSWSDSEGGPEVVFINNISGHFRPNLLASEVDALARVALRLTPETSVLALANDGFRVSGPLAEYLVIGDISI